MKTGAETGTGTGKNTVELYAQADLLMLAGSLFTMPGAEAPPPFAPGELHALAEASGLASPGREGCEALVAAVNAAANEDPLVRAAEHSRLFETSLACPPNETAFVRRDKGTILADIAGFYTAFGLTRSATTGEKEDHIATELQFVALMLVKLARAREADETENAEVTLSALSAFSRDHLDEWLDLFVTHVRQQTALPCYREAAALLAHAWATVVTTHGLARAEAPAAFTPRTDDGTPYECGMCLAEAEDEAERN